MFEQNKNQAGVGVTTKGNTGWGLKIQDIFDGKHPNYPHWKLQERVIRDGYVKQECSNCGYSDCRDKDLRGPFLICFFDGDSSNHSLDNLLTIVLIKVLSPVLVTDEISVKYSGIADHKVSSILDSMSLFVLTNIIGFKSRALLKDISSVFSVSKV